MRRSVMTIAMIATLVACSVSQPWTEGLRRGHDALMKRDYPLAIRWLEFERGMASPADTPDEVRGTIWFWLGVCAAEINV